MKQWIQEHDTLNPLFKSLNIDDESKMEILGRIITHFQIDILKEIEVSGRVKEKIEWLKQSLL